MPDPVHYDVADGVATIAIDRPHVRNAFDLQTVRALHDAALCAAEDTAVRAVVVTGRGGHFSAGGDVRCFGEALAAGGGAGAARLIEELTLYFHGALTALARAEKPVLAAVDGVAAGGGFSMAALADVTVASERAVFTFAYTNIALAPDGGSSWALPRLFGWKRALLFAWRSERLTAREALALGLVQEVYPAAEFESRWRALARDLASGPTRALAAAKRLMRASASRSLEEQLENEREAIAACARTRDFGEGIAAFMAKRPPRFEGR
jgi:2-(1,2-epoxy-1,2-dihydrophenyl)acetyl-CoA isomerase